MKLGRIFARQMCPLLWRLGVTLFLMRGSLVSAMAQSRADWPLFRRNNSHAGVNRVETVPSTATVAG